MKYHFVTKNIQHKRSANTVSAQYSQNCGIAYCAVSNLIRAPWHYKYTRTAKWVVVQKYLVMTVSILASRSWRGDHKRSADERAQSHCNVHKTSLCPKEPSLCEKWKTNRTCHIQPDFIGDTDFGLREFVDWFIYRNSIEVDKSFSLVPKSQISKITIDVLWWKYTTN